MDTTMYNDVEEALLTNHGFKESYDVLPAADDRAYKKNLITINEPVLRASSKIDTKEGLMNVRALFFLVLWYVFSGCTLFLNKYILHYLRGEPIILGTCQMLMTTALGFVQMYFPCGMYKPMHRLLRPPGFYKHMILVGCTRFMTVILGLISLNYVAVSFTETIKSSAPIFTVVISRLLLNEYTGMYVNLSLIPVMSGLALCSVNELSFNMVGFFAALATNLTECLQNVYSKMLISGEDFKYTPAELQFYTSIASIIVQIPATLFLLDYTEMGESKHPFTLFFFFLLNGAFFHFQSITAYVLMDYVSPVTHSVINTVKRAFLIWLSVILFGNSITLLSGLGTAIVILGVMLYNKAQALDKKYSLLTKEHSTLFPPDLSHKQSLSKIRENGALANFYYRRLES